MKRCPIDHMVSVGVGNQLSQKIMLFYIIVCLLIASLSGSRTLNRQWFGRGVADVSTAMDVRTESMKRQQADFDH
jgi:hypothetical protein